MFQVSNHNGKQVRNGPVRIYEEQVSKKAFEVGRTGDYEPIAVRILHRSRGDDRFLLSSNVLSYSS